MATILKQLILCICCGIYLQNISQFHCKIGMDISSYKQKMVGDHTVYISGFCTEEQLKTIQERKKNRENAPLAVEVSIGGFSETYIVPVPNQPSIIISFVAGICFSQTDFPRGQRCCQILFPMGTQAD